MARRAARGTFLLGWFRSSAEDRPFAEHRERATAVHNHTVSRSPAHRATHMTVPNREGGRPSATGARPSTVAVRDGVLADAASLLAMMLFVPIAVLVVGSPIALVIRMLVELVEWGMRAF